MSTVARTIGCIVVLLLLFVPASSRAETHEVTVGDNFFSPSELTIQVGDTVRWVNASGGNIHNVTSNDDAWTPSTTSSSFTFEVTFNNAGVFDYRCTIHPGSMQGVITVQGSMTAAELALQSIDAMNGSFLPGDLLEVNSEIANSGDADSGAFVMNYYASVNNNISENDTLIGTANISDVAMGTTLNRQDMVTIPESLTPGEYFIGAIINFSDGNESDNSNVDGVAIEIRAPFFINAGLNDAWVSDDAPLQGFFFTIFPDLKFFFLSWFTFDSALPTGEDTATFGADDQRWVTASGLFSGNAVDLTVELTTGGVFNASEPLASQDLAYGTMRIVFISCNEAVLTYDFPGPGLSGEITLTRVLEDNVALCQILNEEMQDNP